MTPPSEHPIDTEELMARVRATLGQTDATGEDGPSAPVVLSPHFHQEQLLLDQAQRVANVGTTVPPFGGLSPILRPVARLTTRALHLLLQVITVDQRVFNSLLLNVVRMTSAGLAQGEAALNERWRQSAVAAAARERRITELESAIAALGTALAARERDIATLAERQAAADGALVEQAARVTALEAAAGLAEGERRGLGEAVERAGRRLDLTDTGLAEVRHRVAAAQSSVAAQERRLVNLGEVARQALSGQPPDGLAVARTAVDEAAHALDALYADFEEHFRGGAADITDRLRVYLPDVRAGVGGPDGRVLDLGCGRGEWLSLLAGEGIAARGIDANRIQVEFCRAAGLDVVEGDVFALLAAVPDASTDVVTAFHLIEHLTYDRLVELLDHAVRILRPAGLLILETPNPDNVLVGSCQFYLDPTHRHPLPSPLVKFLAAARGLRDVEVRPLHPSPEYERLDGSDVAARLNRYFYGPRDYAVLGFKA